MAVSKRRKKALTARFQGGLFRVGGIITCMSWFSLKVAKVFGRGLPSFHNQAEAESHLFRERDERIRRITLLAASAGIFAADFTPESLKTLERWYFELWEANGFNRLNISRDEFECCMASYFFEVAVRNCPDAKWEVREFPFEHGKFEIGVQRGLVHLMRTRFTDHYKLPNNKSRQKIYRDYMRHYSP